MRQVVVGVPIGIDAKASTFPSNVVPALSVAKLPSYHQRLDAVAPLVRRIRLLTP